MPAAPGRSTDFQEWLDTADSPMAPPLRSAAVSHALDNLSGPNGTCAAVAGIMTAASNYERQLLSRPEIPCALAAVEGAAPTGAGLPTVFVLRFIADELSR